MKSLVLTSSENKFLKVVNINNLASKNINYGDILIYKDIQKNLPLKDGVYILKCKEKLSPYNIFVETLKDEYFVISHGDKIKINKADIVGFVVGMCRSI